jgi:hypothetical protein
MMLAWALAAQDLSSRLRDDETLVVPGRGAERLLIAEGADAVAARMGTPERIARFDVTGELFEKVYKMPADLKIPYDMIYYYRAKKCVVFLHQGKVSAIAGLSNSRVTDLPADLSRGVERFIFSYGNDGLAVAEKGRNRAYIYGRLGIALFDDGANDGIDMYLVFKARPSP